MTTLESHNRRNRLHTLMLLAARLTSDPLALASALSSIEQVNSPWWHYFLLQGQRHASPSLLRSHPLTTERVERLQQIAQEFRQPATDHLPRQIAMPQHYIRLAPSRWHPFSIWY